MDLRLQEFHKKCQAPTAHVTLKVSEEEEKAREAPRHLVAHRINARKRSSKVRVVSSCGLIP